MTESYKYDFDNFKPPQGLGTDMIVKRVRRLCTLGKPFEVTNGRLRNLLPAPQSRLEALLFSIWKWEFLTALVTEYPDIQDGGILTCGLCVYYAALAPHAYPRCHDPGCPIFQVTGREGCHGTPYEEYTELGRLTAEIAQAEHAFLIQLFQSGYGFNPPTLLDALVGPLSRVAEVFPNDTN